MFIDFITCLPTKADVVNSAASTPGHAADLGAAKKMGDWLDLVQRQGDEFVPIAVESGGRVHEDALDLLSEACGAIGGSPGERQALLTYWRQRVSMANARGVAAVIKARTPLCTGVHHPCSRTTSPSSGYPGSAAASADAAPGGTSGSYGVASATPSCWRWVLSAVHAHFTDGGLCGDVSSLFAGRCG